MSTTDREDDWDDSPSADVDASGVVHAPDGATTTASLAETSLTYEVVGVAVAGTELVPLHLGPLDRNPAAVFLGRYASQNARRTMRYALKVLAGQLHIANPLAVPWAHLRYAHTQRLRAGLAARYAPATANLVIVALRGVLREAWRLGLMSAEDFHRAADIEAVPGSRLPKGHALPPGELRALFDACDPASAKGARDAAILALLYGAGLRRAELASLDIGDYSPDPPSVTTVGKGNKERSVPLPSGSAEALANWIALRGDAPGRMILRVDRHGYIRSDGITDDAVYLIARRLYAAAQVSRCSPHDLRRTFVSDLLDAGADLSVVQRLAGHASPTTTSSYDRRPEATKRRAVDLLHVPFRRATK